MDLITVTSTTQDRSGPRMFGSAGPSPRPHTAQSAPNPRQVSAARAGLARVLVSSHQRRHLVFPRLASELAKSEAEVDQHVAIASEVVSEAADGAFYSAIYDAVLGSWVRRCRLAAVPSEYLGTTGTSSTAERLVSWRQFLGMATRHGEIIGILRLFGHEKIPDRLNYLRGLSDEDPDEPRLELESLRTFAKFVMSERQLPRPAIGLSPSGLVVGQWIIPPDGILALEFRTSDWMRFAAIGSLPHHSRPRERVSGTLQKRGALDAIREFTSKLTQYS